MGKSNKEFAVALIAPDLDRRKVIMEIERRLAERLTENFGRLKALNGKPFLKVLDSQVEFIAGAMAALHAVFGDKASDTMTDWVPPRWVFLPSRGDLLSDYPFAEKPK